MITKRQVAVTGALMLGLASPSLFAIGMSLISQDATFRPFSIEADNLNEISLLSVFGGPLVVTKLTWPADSAGDSGEFAIALKKHLQAQGLPAVIQVENIPAGRKSQLTFEIASSTLGPYARSNTRMAIKSAVTAYKMHSAALEKKEAALKNR